VYKEGLCRGTWTLAHISLDGFQKNFGKQLRRKGMENPLRYQRSRKRGAHVRKTGNAPGDVTKEKTESHHSRVGGSESRWFIACGGTKEHTPTGGEQ